RDPLTAGWPMGLRERANGDGSARPCRFVERLHDPHVLQALVARGFRLAILQDAVGEVQPLRGELIVHCSLLQLRPESDTRSIVSPGAPSTWPFPCGVSGSDWLTRRDGTPVCAQNVMRTPPLITRPSRGAHASTVHRPSTPRDGRRSGSQSLCLTLPRFSA